MQKLRAVVVGIGIVALLFFFTSGGFLVVNDPQHADAIVVLAGEADRRPERGLELLSEGYAPRMVLDVPAGATIFNQAVLDLARSYVQKLPQRDSISICPIQGLSTKAESYDVQRCLSNSGVHSILVVTSDYHTRRARSTFQHTFQGDRISVAAATDPVQFGRAWWQNRQWAKFNFDEWLRLVWWQGVDRWR
jgi:hypothetical protein